MGIKPAMGQAGLGHQPGDARGRHAVLPEQHGRGVDNPLPGGVLVTLFEAHATLSSVIG